MDPKPVQCTPRKRSCGKNAWMLLKQQPLGAQIPIQKSPGIIIRLWIPQGHHHQEKLMHSSALCQALYLDQQDLQQKLHFLFQHPLLCPLDLHHRQWEWRRCLLRLLHPHYLQAQLLKCFRVCKHILSYFFNDMYVYIIQGFVTFSESQDFFNVSNLNYWQMSPRCSYALCMPGASQPLPPPSTPPPGYADGEYLDLWLTWACIWFLLSIWRILLWSLRRFFRNTSLCSVDQM